MGKEIERKFLLAVGASIPIPSRHAKINIKQGYIHVEKDKHTRIRLSKYLSFPDKNFLGEETASVCVKFTKNLVRDEYEIPFEDLKEAKKLYKQCDWFLEKRRLTFNVDNVHYDIDTFPNGITYVEVEFNSVGDIKKWKQPSWLGKEITGLAKYSNIVLAKQKLKF